jgi:naphthoate synthase
MDWITVKEYEDITYKMQWVARIAFNRPDVAMLFVKTTSELYSAFYDAQEDTSIGVVLLSAVLHQKMECILL